MAVTGSVVVDGRGARRARRGHPWIHADCVVETDGACEAGDIVRVLDRDGRTCCWAAWSPSSWIALRRVSRGHDPGDPAFWSRRLAAAVARRGSAAGEPGGCVRLLHADADGFPGLTIDRYGPHLVAQPTTAWADRSVPAIAVELAQAVGATSCLLRNDVAIREREGLPLGVAPLFGDTPEEVEVREAGLPRFVALRSGHKTGLYLDQQENHRAAPGWLAGRVLDLFCGEGGFTVPLAVAGCRVVAVDQGHEVLERGERAALANGVAERVEWLHGNVFDVLAEWDRAGERFDAIVLDPPPFARRRAESGGAERGHRDLHRRALRMLRDGGRLLSFSCSFHVTPADFEQSARDGAEEAGTAVRVLSRPGAAADHPELLELPESRYLKGLLLERRDD
ncbi:MAG: class I SAM-dependent rRNA methyltransferase [Acidobacteria bacterium]|nr:class I SAM-dependent rRNA methyltransferase [Acidobacteriota bacterium]